MKKIHVPKNRLFNSADNTFINIKEQDIQLEHSLVSISKWERKYHKPFLSTKDMTPDETAFYIECMCMTSNVDPITFRFLPREVMQEINDYIADPMTATTFSDNNKGKGQSEILTAEIIYWQMITLGIPVEFQKWHLNSLLTLIKVCSIKNNPDKKKMSKSEIFARNRELNKARRAAMHSAG